MTLDQEHVVADVASVLGLACTHSVNRLIRHGHIKADLKVKQEGGRPAYHVTTQALVDFLKTPVGQKYRPRFQKR